VKDGISKLDGARQGPFFIFISIKKSSMYSLKCSFYNRQFSTLEELIEDIVSSGMDPDYFVTKNGKSTGEKAIVYVF
jgi:hypothetical protein